MNILILFRYLLKWLCENKRVEDVNKKTVKCECEKVPGSHKIYLQIL